VVTRNYILSFILLAAIGIVYANSLSNGFVWDDHEIVRRSRDDTLRDALLGADTVYQDDKTPYFRPFNRITYLSDSRFFGLNPLGYHAVNIFLHGLATVLMFFAVLAIGGSQTVAFGSALLFNIHPVNSETVNFISARNNILASVFILASLLAFLQYKQDGRHRMLLLCGICFFVALLSKEIALMLPLVLIASEYLSESGHSEKMPVLRFLSLYGAPLAIYAVMRMYVLSGLTGTSFLFNELGTRLSRNLLIVPSYLLNFVLPLKLNAHYSFFDRPLPEIVWRLAGWPLLVAVCWYAIRRKDRLALAGLLWFAVNYVPISNIIPFPSSPMADRYFYLPGMGLCLVASSLFDRLLQREGWDRLAAVIAVAVIALFGLITVSRNTVWRDDISLFRGMIAADSQSVFGHYNLAGALFRSGDLKSAQGEWEKTVELQPMHSEALNQLGSAALLAGDFARAETLFRRAVESRPGNAEAQYNLALVLDRLTRPEEARLHYLRFLERVPPEYAELAAEVRRKIGTGIRSQRPD
jgi:tetratricopeptide (TPR) repeat protein